MMGTHILSIWSFGAGFVTLLLLLLRMVVEILFSSYNNEELIALTKSFKISKTPDTDRDGIVAGLGMLLIANIDIRLYRSEFPERWSKRESLVGVQTNLSIGHGWEIVGEVYFIEANGLY